MVLAAENDETRQTVGLLITCLIGIAVALAVLTGWYWFYTDPKRRRAPDRTDAASIEGLQDPPSRAVPEPAMSGDVVETTGPVAAVAALAPGVEGREAIQNDGTPVDGSSAGSNADGPLLARQTWDFVAAAKRAEDQAERPERTSALAAPRIAVADRSLPGGQDRDDLDGADELAVVRRRREREASRGLSDEVWDSVRRSVFDKLDS